jgi:hypothetical protein
MTVRWDSVVVDCQEVRAQARWWAETLGWVLSYEDDDEAEISPPTVVDLVEGGPVPPRVPHLVFVPVGEDKTVKNRLHIDLSPQLEDSQEAEVQALLDRGATRADVGQGDEVTWVVLRDPEGNEFCVLSPRE